MPHNIVIQKYHRKQKIHIYLIKLEIIFDLHNHNLYPAELCEMFVITAFKVKDVKLLFTKSIFIVSIICFDAYLTTALHKTHESI